MYLLTEIWLQILMSANGHQGFAKGIARTLSETTPAPSALIIQSDITKMQCTPVRKQNFYLGEPISTACSVRPLKRYSGYMRIDGSVSLCRYCDWAKQWPWHATFRLNYDISRSKMEKRRPEETKKEVLPKEQWPSLGTTAIRG